MVWQMAAFSAISMVGGAVGQAKAAGDAKSAAMKQAKLYNEQMRHEIKRTKRTHKIMQGETLARIYASNIDYAGSARAIAEEQKTLQTADVAMMERARKLGVRAMKKGAQMQHNAAQWQAASTAVQGFAKGYEALSSAGAFGGSG